MRALSDRIGDVEDANESEKEVTTSRRGERRQNSRMESCGGSEDGRGTMLHEKRWASRDVREDIVG